MNIYVDFDDCLCETGRAFAQMVSELFGKHVPYEDMRYFNLRQAFDLTEEQYDRLMTEGHRPEILLSYEETPGASAVINGWMKEGCDVSVITGRPHSAYEASRLWLDRHGLQNVPLYCLDKYGRENYLKGGSYSLTLEDYYRMHFDFAVEDSPTAFRFFEHLPELKVLVFDRPWNTTPAFPNSNYRRCFSWEDIRAAVAAGT